MLDTSTTELDAVDRRLIGALHAKPRSSTTELAALVGVARGTLYSRLDRLERSGVITGYGPDIDPTAAGLGVVGFCTLEIAQGSHRETLAALSDLAQVAEIHTVTGPGDLLVRVMARSNDHLHEVLQTIAGLPTVGRTQTQLALQSTRPRSVAQIVAESG